MALLSCLMATPPEERFNYAQYLLERNAARPGSPADTDDHESIRYGERADRVRRMSAAIRALGVHREERVLLLMHYNNDWPVGFLGCLHAGVVPVAANTRLPVDDYAYVLAHSRAQAALVSHALLPALEKAMQQGPPELGFALVSRADGR